MLLKDLIANNKITENLFKNLNQKTLLHDVKGVSSNSKEIKKDFIFVVIKGEKFDGADFITEAEENGAFLIIAEKSYNKNVLYIKREKVRHIYTILLASFYSKQPKQIIGVTGTNGKLSLIHI